MTEPDKAFFPRSVGREKKEDSEIRKKDQSSLDHEGRQPLPAPLFPFPGLSPGLLPTVRLRPGIGIAPVLEPGVPHVPAVQAVRGGAGALHRHRRRGLRRRQGRGGGRRGSRRRRRRSAEVLSRVSEGKSVYTKTKHCSRHNPNFLKSTSATNFLVLSLLLLVSAVIVAACHIRHHIIAFLPLRSLCTAAGATATAWPVCERACETPPRTGRSSSPG